MNVRIGGADRSLTNVSGNNYVATLQVAAARSRLFKLTFSPLAGMAADVYAWIHDVAAGTTASAAPVAVRLIPNGQADTWDFSADGSLFANGIFISLSTAAPTDATTTTAATGSGSNKLIVKADYRVLP